ncbi:hypothetical protein Gotur_009922 [Gossypium turneri]
MIASAMLAQAKTKKEYKKLMAEMLSSLDSESKDEKSSESSIKTVDLADDTTSEIFSGENSKYSLQEKTSEQEIFSGKNSKYSLQEKTSEQEIFSSENSKYSLQEKTSVQEIFSGENSKYSLQEKTHEYTVMSGDAGETPLRHPKPVRLLPVQSRSMMTRPVQSSHWLDRQSVFTYRAQYDQFLGFGINFGLSGPIYDIRSNFQVQLPIGPIV